MTVAMVPAVSSIAYFGTILVFTSFSPSLIVAETRGDLSAVESFIDEEKPVLLSQALYVALPKDSRGQYREHIAPSVINGPATLNPANPIVEQRVREIFTIRNEPNPILSDIDDHQVFKVQRTPDGKLSVIYNNTQITPPFVAHTDEDLDNGGGGVLKNHNNRHSQSVRDIVFPTEKPQRGLSGIRPKCAQNSKHFCTEVENYPTALLESVLMADSRRYEQLFGDDLVPPPPINLTQRIDVPGEEPLCNSQERLIYPQAGITKDNNWSIIVNQQNFTQGIRVEECMNPGSPCAMSESFPIGYKTECKQKYIYRQLLSLNGDGQVVKDLFKLPSCCKCVVISSHRFRRDIIENKAPNRQ